MCSLTTPSPSPSSRRSRPPFRCGCATTLTWCCSPVRASTCTWSGCGPRARAASSRWAWPSWRTRRCLVSPPWPSPRRLRVGRYGPRTSRRFLTRSSRATRPRGRSAFSGTSPSRSSANTAATELPLRLLLGSLLQRRGQLDPADLARCGLAARRLLDHHWTLPPAATTRFAIEAVIATADSDPAATEALLRRALQSEQMTGRAYNDLRWQTQGVPQLVGTVPGLVEELYVVAMAYEETSTEPTPLALGRILPMS